MEEGGVVREVCMSIATNLSYSVSLLLLLLF